MKISVLYSSHLTVVVVGFVDTLVEVNEADGQVTLNVSISSPQPDPTLRFEITFSLNVVSMYYEIFQACETTSLGCFCNVLPHSVSCDICTSISASTLCTQEGGERGRGGGSFLA